MSQEKAVCAYAGTNGAAFDKTYAGKTVQKVIDTATTMELVKDTDYEVAADGTLTVRKSYMTEEKVYSFAVLTEDGLSYVIAVNYAFNADGIAPARARDPCRTAFCPSKARAIISTKIWSISRKKWVIR